MGDAGRPVLRHGLRHLGGGSKPALGTGERVLADLGRGDARPGQRIVELFVHLGCALVIEQPELLEPLRRVEPPDVPQPESGVAHDCAEIRRGRRQVWRELGRLGREDRAGGDHRDLLLRHARVRALREGEAPGVDRHRGVVLDDLQAGVAALVRTDGIDLVELGRRRAAREAAARGDVGEERLGELRQIVRRRLAGRVVADRPGQVEDGEAEQHRLVGHTTRSLRRRETRSTGRC